MRETDIQYFFRANILHDLFIMVYSVDQVKTWRGVPNNWPFYFLPSTYWMRILSDSAVKKLPGMQETQVLFLGQEDLLEKELATHYSILAWEIPWTEEPEGLQSRGLQRVGHDWVTNTSLLNHVLSLQFWPFGVLSPRDFPGKNTVVGCHFLLQGTFLTQGSNHVSCIGRQLLYHWVMLNSC